MEDYISAEYQTFKGCIDHAVETIANDVGAFRDQLFAVGYISRTIAEDYYWTDGVSNKQKARKMVDCILGKIARNPAVYHGFMDLEITQDRCRENFVQFLTKRYEEEIMVS